MDSETEDAIDELMRASFEAGWKAHLNRRPGESYLQAEWWFMQNVRKRGTNEADGA